MRRWLDKAEAQTNLIQTAKATTTNRFTGLKRASELSIWKNMFFKKKKPKNKISEMIMEYAENFILEGEDEFEKQQRLNTAASAWNFACLSDTERERSIKKYLKECKKLNPEYTKKDLMEIKSVLKDLIAEKIRMYPDIRVQIFNAQLKEDSGKAYVSVVSADIR